MKNFFLSCISPVSHGTYADAGMLILRISVGVMMALHGWAKITHFSEFSKDFYDFLGLGDPVSLGLTVFSEFFCSILLIFGLLTRFATIPLLITMAVIIFDVSAGSPMYERESPILYGIAYITLLITGAGKYSLDYKLFSSAIKA